MSNIVNLGRFKKKKARADKEATAEENRAKHGLTKAEKSKYKRDIEKLKSHLDGSRVERSDDGE